MTTTIVIHAHYFGYNFDGSSADPDDPVAFAAWEAGGCVGGPPSSGTATLVTEINNLSPLIPPFESTGDYTDTTETRYELPLTYIEWLATVRAAVDAEFNFDEAPAECLGTDCTAALTEIYETTPGYDQEIILTKVRYRYQVPVEHLGTYFKITWDEWSFPSVGPPAVITADITEEWTGPGSGAQSDPSWDLGTWHTLQIPDEPGTSSTANFRFLCKHPGRYGAALQTDGPAAP
jgi:hypothetical protein